MDAQVIVSQVEDFYNEAFRPNQGSGLESSENIASGDGTPRQSPDGDPHSQVSHSLNPGEAPVPLTDVNVSQNHEPEVVSRHPETPPSGERPTETIVDEPMPLNPTPLNNENVSQNPEPGAVNETTSQAS